MKQLNDENNDVKMRVMMKTLLYSESTIRTL